MRSQDGQVQQIGYRILRALYDLPEQVCTRYDPDREQPSHIHLRPRATGDYAEHLERVLGAATESTDV